MKTTTRLLPVLLALLATVPSAAQLVPLGPEFLVDEEPRFFPYCPDVAGRGDRGFTVAWGAERSSLHARSYNGAGVPLSAPIVVDEGLLEGYNLQEVTIENRPGQGDLVLWSSDLIRASDPLRYDSRVVFPAPGPVSRLRVPRYVEQVSPRRSGGYIAAWHGRRGFTATALDSAGRPVGQPARLSQGPLGSAFLRLAHAVDGSFAAVWVGSDGLRLRRFGADLRPLGAEVEAIPPRHDPGRVVLASSPDGRTAVAWSQADPEDGSVDVYVRFFGPGGAPESGPLLLEHHLVQNSFRFPEAIALNGQGRALVVWAELPASGGAPYQFAVQLWSAAGPASEVMDLGSTPIQATTFPPFCGNAAAAGRSFVVAWLADAPSGTGKAVYARRFFAAD